MASAARLRPPQGRGCSTFDQQASAATEMHAAKEAGKAEAAAAAAAQAGAEARAATAEAAAARAAEAALATAEQAEQERERLGAEVKMALLRAPPRVGRRRLGLRPAPHPPPWTVGMAWGSRAAHRQSAA